LLNTFAPSTGSFMEHIKFLGLYSGNLLPVSKRQSNAPIDRQHWYIWLSQNKQRYIVQSLDKSHTPTGVLYSISALQFGLNFIEESDVSFQQPDLPDMSTLKNYGENMTQGNSNKESAKGVAPPSGVTATQKGVAAPSGVTATQKGVAPPSGVTATQKGVAPQGKTTLDKQSAPQTKIKSTNTSKSGKSTTTAKSEITYIDGNSASEKKEKKKEGLQKTVDNSLDEANPEVEEKLLLPRDSFDKKRESIRTIRLDKDFRADFESAMTLWTKGKKSVAVTRFKSLLKQNSSFIKSHKHMFTDCAIKLRKIHQNDLALTFAMRCTDLSPEDSHTFFNVGRLYYELREYQSSGLYIDRTLELEPDLAPATKLRQVIIDTLARVEKTR